MAIANITGNILTDSGVSTSSLISGTGTTNYLPKFTGTSTLGNSLIYDNGTNVGIGTASPFAIADTNLSVNGTTSSAIQLGFNGTRYGQFYTDSGEIRLSAVANLPLTFYSNNLERMRISATGNVGIGTSSPAVPLDIQSNSNASAIRIRGRSADDIAEVDFYNYANNSLMARIQADTGYLLFDTNGTERMRIRSDGNVAIGSSSGGYASTRLSVTGVNTSSSNYVVYFEDSGTNTLFSVRNDGVVITGTRTNSPYNLAVSGRDLYVASDGGLGYNSSVRESKINIENIDSVEWLLDLNPVSFNKRKKDQDGKYTDEYYEDLDYGLIAEEAELVNDKICFYDESEEGRIIRGVSYSKLTTPMLKLIQQQQAKIEELSAKVSALENSS